MSTRRTIDWGNAGRDPWTNVDRHESPGQLAQLLETRWKISEMRLLYGRFAEFCDLLPSRRVLEVGSGTGVFVRALANQLPRIFVGIDLSWQLTLEARRLQASASGGAPLIEFLVGDGAALPIRDGSFDASVIITTLGHASEPLMMLRELARALAPGGTLCVLEQDHESFIINHPDRETTRKIFQYFCDTLVANGWSARRVPGWLKACGMKDIAVSGEMYLAMGYQDHMRSLITRRVDAAVGGGRIMEEMGRRWLADLEAVVAEDAFFASWNFYFFKGRKA